MRGPGLTLSVRRGVLLVVSLCLTFGSLTVGVAEASDLKGLPDYPSEVELLVDTPGTSGSIAAGMFNPAAWSFQDEGSLFLAWDDLDEYDKSNWTGALSARGFGFGWRRFNYGLGGRNYAVNDYTMGFGSGSRSGSYGISYSWGSGDTDVVPRHERLVLGSISRWRYVSLGLSETLDFESRDNFFQADLGIRPIGPRLTFFGDAVYGHGDGFEDIRGGYGVEARLIPGLAVAAKAQNTGEFSFRVSVDLSREARVSYRPHFDEDADMSSSTYAIEMGPDRTPIGYGRLGAGQSYPEMHLKGGMAYQRYRLFDNRRTLLGTLKRIAHYADDPLVGGVVVNLSGMALNYEMTWELGMALEGLRAKGKKVVVYFDNVSPAGCALASVADQVWMDRIGIIDISGVSMGRTYYKHALEKMGVGFDEWRFFTYKSAMEGFSRDSLSEPDREQRQAIIDDIYETAAEMITSGRGISRADFDKLVNEKGLLLCEEALAAGLVDSIGSFQDAKKAAREAVMRESVSESGTELEGLLGDNVWGPLEWGEPPHIALLYAIGPCAMDSGIKARTLSRRIRAARDDPRVKAVVLRADSPGGDALASDLIARELKETAKRKPVIVSQGWVAGSGGYWISMYGDTIVASPVTITGSIGVIGGWFWNEGLGEKIGFDFDGVKRGEHADLGDGIRLPFINQVVPERPLTEEENERMENLIRTMYEEFVAKVAAGRGMTEEEVDAIGQGRIWSGIKGKEIGLVDELGGLWLSLKIAKEAAGIPTNEPIVIEEGPELGWFSMNMFTPKLFGVDEPPADMDGEAISPAHEAVELLPEEEMIFLRHMIGSKGRPLFMMEPLGLRDGSW